MTYEPRPVDTSGIELAAQILELTEQLARNTHEVWARKRIDDGWTWGPIRDDKARQHPGQRPGLMKMVWMGQCGGDSY
jgi:hypothetical protein